MYSFFWDTRYRWSIASHTLFLLHSSRFVPLIVTPFTPHFKKILFLSIKDVIRRDWDMFSCRFICLMTWFACFCEEQGIHFLNLNVWMNLYGYFHCILRSYVIYYKLHFISGPVTVTGLGSKKNQGRTRAQNLLTKHR